MDNIFDKNRKNFEKSAFVVDKNEKSTIFAP